MPDHRMTADGAILAPLPMPSLRTVAYILLLGLISTVPFESLLVLPGLGSASQLCGLALCAAWLVQLLINGNLRRLTAFHALTSVFLLWCTATILWSIDPALSLEKLADLAQLAFLTLIVWDLIRTPESVRAALQAYVLGSWAPALSTIGNFLAGRQTVYGRYAAGSDNANTTGIILAISLPLAWHLVITSGTARHNQLVRALNALFIAAAMFAIVLTATRFAMAMALVPFGYVLFALRRSGVGKRALLFSSVLVAVLAAPVVLPPESLERLMTADEEMAQGDLNGRGYIWSRGMQVWRTRPIIGIGCRAFDHAMIPWFGRPRSAHNTFVAILVELGIVGLALWLAIGKQVLWSVLFRGRGNRAFWMTALGVLLLGNLPMTYYHTKMTWILLGLAVAAAHLPREESQAEQTVRARDQLWFLPAGEVATPTGQLPGWAGTTAPAPVWLDPEDPLGTGSVALAMPPRPAGGEDALRDAEGMTGGGAPGTRRAG